jgi:D-sedoheptulose 7-phosphate isomerase
MQSIERPVDNVSSSASAMAYLADLTAVLRRVPAEPLGRAIDALLEAREHGRRVYVFGNGGSAATASHFVCDLVKGAQVPGFRPFRAFSLTDSTPLMTAISNDIAYGQTFAHMLEALVEPDDIALGISASGSSPNLVEGLKTAARLGARTIALLGFDGGAALTIAEIAVHVPCSDYGLVEDTHAALGHAMTLAVRRTLEAERARDLVRLA